MGDDVTPTKVSCPVCTPCPACHDVRVISTKQRSHYRAAKTLRKDPCPRCAYYGTSDICTVCEGTQVVAPGVTSIWQALHAQTRRASSPGMPAVDPRKDPNT